MAALVRERRPRVLVSRFVHQCIHSAPELDGGGAGNGIQGVRHRGSPLPRADQAFGAHHAAIRQRHRSARLQIRQQRPARDAGGVRPRHVERARPVRQRHAKAVRRDAVRQRPALDQELRPFDADLAAIALLLEHSHFHVAGPQRSGSLEVLQERREAGRAGDDQRALPSLEPERSEEAGKPVEVIAVQMGDQYSVEAREAEARAQRSDLGAFSAVAEHPGPLRHDGERGRPAR